MYVPVDSNPNPYFSVYASEDKPKKQVDCAATETYTGAVTNTSCVVAIDDGLVSGEDWSPPLFTRPMH